MLGICRYMGWSWAELMATPGDVLAALRGWMRREAERARRDEIRRELENR